MRNKVTALTFNSRTMFINYVINDIKKLDISHVIYQNYTNENMTLGLIKFIDNCTTDYFCICDDDDRFPDTGALQDMLNHLDEYKNTPYAFSVENLIDINGGILKKGRHYSYDRKHHKNNALFVHELILFRKQQVSDLLKQIRISNGRSIMYELPYNLTHTYPAFMSKCVGRLWRQHDNQ